jgi:cyclohexanecarboxylate-CoA ligase
MWETLILPEPEQAAGYRASGWWRDEGFLDDLATAAAKRPEHPAIIGYRDGSHERTLSYADLAAAVERFAAGLAELGVRRGDVVALYLPNRWMLTVLYLACGRVGAVAMGVHPAQGARELGIFLDESRATVAITVDRFAGIDYATRLAAVAPPTLRHRVIVDRGPHDDTAIDFEEFFVRTPWEERRPVPASAALGPDVPSMLLYTSGTTGRMKGVAHSQNTLYASVRTIIEAYGLTEADVICVPHFLAHMAAAVFAGFTPLVLGATTVLQDTNADMELLLDLIADHAATWAYAAPGYLVAMIAAQRARPRDTSSLKVIVSGSAPIQPQLIEEVRDVLGIPLHALWGMTENGGVTMTKPADPAGWAAHSDGSPPPWMSVRIDEPGPDGFGRLLVRGAAQCLGYLDQRAVYEACLDSDGWFDTGDLARDDGRGGIRIGGRRADLITRATGIKVPTLELEGIITRHPAVAEVVLVGYPDPAVPGTELACAVVVPVAGVPAPTLEDVRAHLSAEQVATYLWPDRLVVTDALPKNSLSKVLRTTLREGLESPATSAR